MGCTLSWLFCQHHTIFQRFLCSSFKSTHDYANLFFHDFCKSVNSSSVVYRDSCYPPTHIQTIPSCYSLSKWIVATPTNHIWKLPTIPVPSPQPLHAHPTYLCTLSPYYLSAIYGLQGYISLLNLLSIREIS